MAHLRACFNLTWDLTLSRIAKESRRAILNSRQNQKASWIGLAVAHYLEGDNEQSLAIMDAYEETLPVRSNIFRPPIVAIL